LDANKSPFPANCVQQPSWCGKCFAAAVDAKIRRAFFLDSIACLCGQDCDATVSVDDVRRAIPIDIRKRLVHLPNQNF
jgi:hypothetical protein